jgi:hypothetical protein
MHLDMTRNGSGVSVFSCIFEKSAAVVIGLDDSVSMILEPVHISVLGCNRENAS